MSSAPHPSHPGAAVGPIRSVSPVPGSLQNVRSEALDRGRRVRTLGGYSQEFPRHDVSCGVTWCNYRAINNEETNMQHRSLLSLCVGQFMTAIIKSSSSFSTTAFCFLLGNCFATVIFIAREESHYRLLGETPKINDSLYVQCIS